MPPPVRWRATSVLNDATPRASSAVNGSSRIHSGTPPLRNSRASAMRRRCPCERKRASESSNPTSPTASSAPRTVPSSASSPAMPAEARRFSTAVRSSLTPFRCPTYASALQYSSFSARIALPRQRISPCVGWSSPHSMRSRLVLPVPFGPATRSSVPGSPRRPSPLNSTRSPRVHSRSRASSIRRVGSGRWGTAGSSWRYRREG